MGDENSLDQSVPCPLPGSSGQSEEEVPSLFPPAWERRTDGGGVRVDRFGESADGHGLVPRNQDAHAADGAGQGTGGQSEERDEDGLHCDEGEVITRMSDGKKN